MIKLSDHFNYKRLFRFTLPSISMLLFLSIYGVVDGFFVSNYVGKISFSALNFVMPFLMFLGFIGFLFGTGGSALIAKTLGEGDRSRANKIFSLLIYVSIICGIIFTIAGFILLPNVAEFLGADGEFLEQSIIYGRIVILALTFDILQVEFQTLFVTAEKPQLGFYMTVAAGLINIFLDAIFIVGFDFGIEGAATATAISQFFGGVIPFIYFTRPNSSLLRLTKTNFDLNVLIKTCSNGVSELMSTVSMSIVGTLYNVQLLKYAGEDGVAAFGILMYINFMFHSIFIGYSVGSAPLISYHFGAKNYYELKNLLKRSFVMIAVFAILMFTSAEIFARSLAMIFVSYDQNLLEMTVHAFRIYSFAFLLAGFTIFTSSFFTALNDGVTSAIISFLHMMVFETSAILILPLIFGLNGIWFSMIVAEFMAIIISILFLKKYRSKFKYY